eukprot:993477_1
MKSIFLTHISLLCVITLSQYKMGPYITCLEQNDEYPYGFKESATYGYKGWCNQTDPDMVALTGYDRDYWCDVYSQPIPESRFGGRGDVCDHEDPETKIVRNTCKGAFMFLETPDDEKSWSWKCAEISGTACPIKSDYGIGMTGCLLNRKRAQCCCQTDFCQSHPIYAEYAAYARADHWPTDFDALLAIESGDDMCIVVDSNLPGTEELYNAGKYQFHEITYSGDPNYPGSQYYLGNCDFSIGGLGSGGYDMDTDGTDGIDGIDSTDNEYDIVNEVNDNNEEQVTTEECTIKEAIPNDCDCGAFCSGTEYEYRASVSKCGD